MKGLGSAACTRSWSCRWEAAATESIPAACFPGPCVEGTLVTIDSAIVGSGGMFISEVKLIRSSKVDTKPLGSRNAGRQVMK